VRPVNRREMLDASLDERAAVVVENNEADVRDRH
jgi:hypothetical protein